MSKRVKIEIEVEIPEKCNYVAVDNHCPGIYGYEEKPETHNEEWEWDGEYELAHITNWRDTLTEVKHDEINDTYCAMFVAPRIAAWIMAKAEAGDIDMTIPEFVRLSKIRKSTSEIDKTELDFLLTMASR